MQNIFMTSKKSFALLVTAGATLLPLLLSGCGGGDNSSSTSAPPTPAVPLSVSATAPDGLTATLSENTATVPVGGSVTYTLTLTNDTSQSITYIFPGGDLEPTVGGSITIDNSAQQLVYPVGLGTTTIALSPITVTLAPGQSSSATETINASSGFNFTPAGAYTAEATFNIQNSAGANEQVTTGPLTVTAQ